MTRAINTHSVCIDACERVGKQFALIGRVLPPDNRDAVVADMVPGDHVILQSMVDGPFTCAATIVSAVAGMRPTTIVIRIKRPAWCDGNTVRGFRAPSVMIVGYDAHLFTKERRE